MEKKESTNKRAYQPEEKEFDERVIDIARVAKVVKGGRLFHFRATMIAGDNNGRVGMGIGKAGTVTDAIAKATIRAHSNMKKVSLYGTTIPHEITTKVAGAVVLLKPASQGTGVIAGSGVRAVLEVAGVRDILTKSMGSANVLNIVKATFKALEQLKTPEEFASMRGKPVSELMPFWDRRKNG
jgi:small subunit ribosomal protein S5